MDIEITTKHSDGHTEKVTLSPEGAKRKTTTSTSVKRKYNEKTYDEIRAQLPKELVAEFRARLLERGDTVASVIREAVKAYLAESDE